MDVVVDAYGEEERAMGWYYYLSENLGFPFSARCGEKRSANTIKKGDTLEVLDMADDDICKLEMLVSVDWRGEKINIPLAQIFPESDDPDTVQAVEDWLYWCERNYQF